MKDDVSHVTREKVGYLSHKVGGLLVEPFTVDVIPTGAWLLCNMTRQVLIQLLGIYGLEKTQ